MQGLNVNRDFYIRTLESGGAIFQSGVEVAMPGSRAKTALPAMEEVLRSDVSKEQKVSRLTEYVRMPFIAEELVQNWDGRWPDVNR